MFKSRLDRIVQRAIRRQPGDWTWNASCQTMRCRDVVIERLPRSNVWVMHTGIGNVVLSSRTGRHLAELRDKIDAASQAAA